MKDAAAYAGVFSDFKLVKTRSMAQFIIEIPIEQADAALAAMGGVPQAGREKPVAIARINTQQTSHAPEKPADGRNGNGADKRRFTELPRATQAALCCKRRAFRRWLREFHGISTVDVGLENEDPVSVASAEAWVKGTLGITSKTELDKVPMLGEQWDCIYITFHDWLIDPEAA